MKKDELKYTKDHEWIKVEGTSTIVGITDYAQQQLGDITFVELPETGKTIKAHEELCVIESVKAASDIFAPVGGTISEINQTLEDAPETINEAPFEGGWICKLSNINEDESGDLMSFSDYEEYIKGLD